MENINNDKSKQSESTPDKSSNHSDPSSYPNQSIATPKQDPLSLYDQILQTYHSAVQAFEHFIQTFDSFQSQCRQLNTAIRSLDLNDSIDKRLHTPLFEYSNNLNTSYPYTASLIRNHSTQFQGFAALGIWYPLSKLGRKVGIIGAAFGLTSSFAMVQLVNYQYNFPKGLKLKVMS